VAETCQLTREVRLLQSFSTSTSQPSISTHFALLSASHSRSFVTRSQTSSTSPPPVPGTTRPSVPRGLPKAAATFSGESLSRSRRETRLLREAGGEPERARPAPTQPAARQGLPGTAVAAAAGRQRSKPRSSPASAREAGADRPAEQRLGGPKRGGVLCPGCGVPPATTPQAAPSLGQPGWRRWGAGNQPSTRLAAKRAPRDGQ